MSQLGTVSGTICHSKWTSILDSPSTMPLNFDRLAPTDPRSRLHQPRSTSCWHAPSSHSYTISSISTSRQSAIRWMASPKTVHPFSNMPGTLGSSAGMGRDDHMTEVEKGDVRGKHTRENRK